MRRFESYLENYGQGRWGFGWKLAGEVNLSTCICIQKLALLGPAVCSQLNYDLDEIWPANVPCIFVNILSDCDYCQPKSVWMFLAVVYISWRTYERTNEHTAWRQYTVQLRNNGIKRDMFLQSGCIKIKRCFYRTLISRTKNFNDDIVEFVREDRLRKGFAVITYNLENISLKTWVSRCLVLKIRPLSRQQRTDDNVKNYINSSLLENRLNSRVGYLWQTSI